MLLQALGNAVLILRCLTGHVAMPPLLTQNRPAMGIRTSGRRRQASASGIP